jgi:DNA invertase Pin-like site-specific DNA recombinase
MRQFAKGNGWRALGEYVDRGESARTMKRPELQKLIRFCKERKASALCSCVGWTAWLAIFPII